MMLVGQSRLTWAGSTILLVLCVACEWHPQIRVPEDKAEFVGRWSDGSNYMHLYADGRIDLYLEWPGGAIMVREGSLRRFKGQEICFGVVEFLESNCLGISEEPYEDDGRVMIELRGIQLRSELTPALEREEGS